MTMSMAHAETLRAIQASLTGLSQQVAGLLAEIEAASPLAATAELTDLPAAVIAADAVIGEPVAKVLQSEPVTEAATGDDFSLVRGIDGSAHDLLSSLGVTRFGDLAAFTAEDVAEVSRMLGEPKRISREGWIEQAAVLATGRSTVHAAAAGFSTSIVPHVQADAGEPLLVATEAPARTEASAATAVETAVEGSADVTVETAVTEPAAIAAATIETVVTDTVAIETRAIETVAPALATEAATEVDAVVSDIALSDTATNVVDLAAAAAQPRKKRTSILATAAASLALLAIGAAYSLEGAGFPACKLLQACGTHVAAMQD